MTPFTKPRRPLAGRALAALLCCLLALSAVLAAPTASWAVTASELEADAQPRDDEPWFYEDEYSDTDSGDTSRDDLISATTPTFGIGNLGNIWNALTHWLYGQLAGAISLLASTADEFMTQIGTGQLIGDVFADEDGPYASALGTVLNVANNVIIPVSNAFLGLALVFSLMSFTREAGAGGRQGVDLLASYMWIGVKYALLSSCVSHSVDIMRGVFGVVNYIGTGVERFANFGSFQMGGFASSFTEICRSLTFGDGWGVMVAFFLFALIGLIAAGLTAIYTQVVIVVRIFEICVLMCFSGIAFVMLGNQGTREGGIRYIKRFASCCVQALVLLLVIGLGTVFMNAAASMFANAQATGLAGFVMNVVGPLVSSIAIFLMVKQSRDIANAIVGL